MKVSLTIFLVLSTLVQVVAQDSLRAGYLSPGSTVYLDFEMTQPQLLLDRTGFVVYQQDSSGIYLIQFPDSSFGYIRRFPGSSVVYDVPVNKTVEDLLAKRPPRPLTIPRIGNPKPKPVPNPRAPRCREENLFSPRPRQLQLILQEGKILQKPTTISWQQ